MEGGSSVEKIPPDLNDNTECLALYKQFLGEDFDVRTHASEILQGVVVSEQLVKLADGITSLNNYLQKHVTSHYEDLLSQVTGIEKLEGVLTMMQTHIQCLLSAVDRLRSKILEPYNKIQNQTIILERLQTACEMLRRIIQIMHLSKRLQSQMKGGINEITKAAQSLSDLDQLFRDVDMSGIEVIEEDQKLTRQRRAEVERNAEQLLLQGMQSQNQTQVATALQVFDSLGTLVTTVHKILDSLKDQIHKSIQDSVDVRGLMLSTQEHVGARGVPGRVAMPPPGSVPAMRTVLWKNLEKLMEMIYTASVQINHLQKVLMKKQNPITHTSFSDKFAEVGCENILQIFWDGINHVLQEEFQKAATSSSFVREAFEVEYPKFLRLYSELWKKLQTLNTNLPPEATHVDEDGNVQIIEELLKPSPVLSAELETALRNTLAPFENAYLQRSLSCLFDPINIMFYGSKTVPVKEETNSVIKAIASELNASIVDPVLNKNVCKNIAKTVDQFCSKCELLVVTDGEASQVIASATCGQLQNAETVNLLHHFEKQLRDMFKNISGCSPDAVSILDEALLAIPTVTKTAVKPLLASIQDAIESIILTMHDDNFSHSMRQDGATKPDAPCSAYMRELQGFIARVVSDYLSLYQNQDFITKSVQPLACRCLELFVRHASLIRPLGEGGKMRLAADFAQMEMAVTPFVHRAGDLGKPYRILRSFRPLLFQTPEHILSSPALGEVIPYSLVLHFLFARAPENLKSPHQTAGWSVTYYSNWLDNHPSEKERLLLVQGTLESYVQGIKKKQSKEFAPVYPIMLQMLQKGIELSSVN